MTLYFAPPGAPIDGDNWQELGMISEDGVFFEESETVETWQGEAIRTSHSFTMRFTQTKRQHLAMLKVMFPGRYRFGGPPLIHNGKKPRSRKATK